MAELLNLDKWPPTPTICLSCGSWLDERSASKEEGGGYRIVPCPCGYLPAASTRTFFLRCEELESRASRSFYLQRARRASTGFGHGWGPALLAIVSAFLLGLMTNASYEVVKRWLRARRGEYKALYGRTDWDYEKLLDAVGAFIENNPEFVDQVKIELADTTLEIIINGRVQTATSTLTVPHSGPEENGANETEKAAEPRSVKDMIKPIIFTSRQARCARRPAFLVQAAWFTGEGRVA